MAVTNPFTITYGALAVGGSSETLLLHGPYVIDKSYSGIRLVFDVIVVASSYATLQSISDSVELGFSKRDVDLSISIDGNDWTYTFGSTILNTTATCQKSGNPETDRGYSRAYTCVVMGELPAEDNGGLRDLEVNVDYSSGRQKTVTMRGVYTAVAAEDSASAQYASDFDAEAATLLTGIDASATFELVDENYNTDRNDHTASFSRQYVELLADQSASATDDAYIRDHRIVFTDLSQHPGDGDENIYRMRRVIGTYDCAIDIEQTTDLADAYATKVKPHVLALFESTFQPAQFAIDNERVSYDETAKRMSIELQFIYQSSAGSNIVEVSWTNTIRETRTIDYTPVHGGNELAAYVDEGWLVRERILMRTTVAIGSGTSQSRLLSPSASGKLAGSSQSGSGGGLDTIGGDLNQTGWNTISSVVQTSPSWIGDPASGQQIQITTTTETVIDRYSIAPGGIS